MIVKHCPLCRLEGKNSVMEELPLLLGEGYNRVKLLWCKICGCICGGEYF